MAAIQPRKAAILTRMKTGYTRISPNLTQITQITSPTGTAHHLASR
jgi:hypothetical protein